MSCFLVGSLQPCGHLLGKGQPLGSIVCDVFLCFCHFSICCPVPGLDCIDSYSLHSYLLYIYINAFDSCMFTFQEDDLESNHAEVHGNKLKTTGIYKVLHTF